MINDHAIRAAGLIGTFLLLPCASHSGNMSQSVEVVAFIEPEISLSVRPATGERIDFGRVPSGDSGMRYSRPVDVEVEVFSNLGRPYDVTQHLRRPMSNRDGARIPEGHLIVGPAQQQVSPETFVGKSADQLQVIMQSDHSDRQTVSYQLRVPPRQSPGRYAGTVVMTVTAR